MAANQDDDVEKSHEPTQTKLEEARRKGDIARSTDLTTAGSYAGLLLAFMFAGAGSLTGLGAALTSLLDQPDRLAPLVFGGSAAAGLKGLAVELPLLLAPWFLFPALAALTMILLQRIFVFTPSHLAPRLSRISLLHNAGQKFGRVGLFEFAKSLVKMAVYSVVLWFFLKYRLDDLMVSIWTEPGIAMVLLGKLTTAFLFVVLGVSILVGLADLFWQKQEHIRKNRMSHKELRDEAKEAEGDPYLKQERRNRGYEIATNRMMLDVPTADVVIVNPTHYAVALKWSRKRGEAPICVAKGVDDTATRIRALALENGVPLHSDPPTARALFATTDIGVEIAPQHYRAVAAAIRFAETIRRKRRGKI